MGNKIRIGVIGAGANTRAMHISKLQAIKDVEILSVCNRSRASGETVAKEFGIKEVCDSWEQVLDDDYIDAVVIGTWPYMHCVLTCAALEAGKHVLCEARMAMNAEEAHEMWETSKVTPGLVAQIVPSPFTLKFDRTIQDLISEGFIGDPLAIEVRGVSSTFVDKASPLHWRQNFDLSGYNTLAMGIWYEALMRWVGEARQVMAMSKTFVKQRNDPATGRPVAVRVPEHLDIIADMVCGAQAHMQFSVVTGLATNTSEAWLFGSEGTLRLDIDAGKLYGGTRRNKKLREIPIPPEKAGGWRVEEEFINAIRGEEAIQLTTLADGVKYMEFTEAVARSAASGSAIGLPLKSMG